MRYGTAAFVALSTWYSVSVDAFQNNRVRVSRDASVRVSQRRVRRATALAVGGGYGDDELPQDSADDSWNENLKSQLERRKAEAERKAAEGQGGSRLRELMKVAQQRTGGAVGGGPDLAAPPSGGIENPFLAQQPAPAVGGGASDIDSMSAEELRQLLRQGGAVAGHPTPAPLPAVTRARPSPRPVGRNRDADSISNTSDLYFAQLKRDSSVRTVARYTGDEETANNVMGDEGIEQLEELLYTNPYLKQGREKEKELFDTVPEEALRPYFTDSNKDQQSTYAGVSYRDKLKERLSKAGKTSEQSVTPQQNLEQTSAPPQEQQQQQPPEVTPEPQASSVPAPTAAVTETSAPVPAPVEQTAAQPSSQPSVATKSSDETRTDIRTLMGLTLKHRGGPGFGSGRLKGDEINKFEGLLNDVTQTLKEEARNNHQGTSSTTSPQDITGSAQSQQPASAASASNAGKVDGAIACIEGAVTLYKNSPTEIQSTILVSLRAAMQSAMATMNGVLGGEPPASVGLGNVGNAIACMEGAITMYKNSPTEIQPTILVSLRAALASAIVTIDSIIKGKGGFSVLTVESEAAPVESAPQSTKFANDENSAMLEEVYNKISRVAGDGAMGIDHNASPDDIEQALDGIQEMRSILMDEADNGIPRGQEQTPATVPTNVQSQDPSSGTASKYQEMLAKARAAREK